MNTGRGTHANRTGLRPFMFATGIENSYPTIALPDGRTKRIDEMAKAGHYEWWERDFELVRELGIDYLRYGPPYYMTHVGPGAYDWEFTDATFERLRQLEITPIADLCHFGVPDWIGGFQNDDWPELFAEYAGAFARRFPWVELYTPVNEILIAALFSGLNGWWNDREQSDRAFVRALEHLCRANILAQRAILECTPRATFVQSETTGYVHAECPHAEPRARFLNERRFLASDLIYGHPINVQMYEYLLDNGMTRDQYHWFERNHVKTRCVMGNDYYILNEQRVTVDGEVGSSGEIFGFYVIAKQYYERYRLPVMHTETNLMDAERAPEWLNKEWANMHRLKLDGVPILGFTWYSLVDQVDWDTALREDRGCVNPLGLVDLNRNLRPVGAAYRDLIAQWRDILPTESWSVGMND